MVRNYNIVPHSKGGYLIIILTASGEVFASHHIVYDWAKKLHSIGNKLHKELRHLEHCGLIEVTPEVRAICGAYAEAAKELGNGDC